MPKTTVVDKKRKKWNEENMRKAVIAVRCKQMSYLKHTMFLELHFSGCAKRKWSLKSCAVPN
ncbi:unnamed protein product [Acanthoscelides obtectus]|uniref:Uncharacterized protein n=1 Tax=Acanthoscelides obtectus TaxID=200917 RepID=A0A9P0PPJ7_ACAOB|nr:unnamed protein product [Acanthoscelides obtectus]CAK1662812.1 hypothetical protein AOBTE_LOCUS23327 [Acanthoscelides obtectus]